MEELSQTHPSTYAAFEQEEFVVQRSDGSLFAQVAVEQTIEQTINRDCKTAGVIVGCSLRQGASQRWILTAHARAEISFFMSTPCWP